MNLRGEKMADQPRTDIAAVTEALARSLWIAEFGSSPKASDVKFLQLVLVCNEALSGRTNISSIGAVIPSIFAKPK